jgi:hypothetical protein
VELDLWRRHDLGAARAETAILTKLTRQLTAVDAALDGAVETLAPVSELLQISSANS